MTESFEALAKVAHRAAESETHYGTFEAPAGHVETLVPPAENIHSVAAVGESKTISIHVYGADIERLGSSILRRFDDVRQPSAAA